MLTSRVNAVLVISALAGSPAAAQTSHSTAALAQSGQSVPAITLPPITVTAQKEPADPKTLPVSMTVVSADGLERAGITTVSEAGPFSPNTSFTEFTARKLSNPRIRGLGAGPSNPGVTTYFDGVPQLNANSSSTALLDISQIEFVRGPQSTLFGRNALGGLISLATARPSLTKWTGVASVPFGRRRCGPDACCDQERTDVERHPFPGGHWTSQSSERLDIRHQFFEFRRREGVLEARHPRGASSESALESPFPDPV